MTENENTADESIGIDEQGCFTTVMRSRNDTKVLRVVLVDDHAMVRQALSAVLREDSRFEVVGEAGCRSEAIELTTEARPDVVILDYNMPDGGALVLIGDLRRLGVTAKILVLTVHDTVHYAMRALESGASGFVVKTAAVEELKEALFTLQRGRIYLSSEMSAQVIGHLRNPRRERIGIDALSEREFELLRAMGRGLSMKAAAVELKVSVSTASTYRARIARKLGLEHTADLIRFAIENGVV